MNPSVDLIDFQWTRCPDRYELAADVFDPPRARTAENVEKPIGPLAIKAKSEQFKSYRPLADFPHLFGIFANAASTSEGMLGFSNKFGLLGNLAPGPKPAFGRHVGSQMIEELLEYHSKMRDAYTSFERNDTNGVV